MAKEPGYSFTPDHPADVLVFAEWLLSHTLDDLGGRLKAEPVTDRYTVLGIAPLLRKLIIDSPSVLTKVLDGRRKLYGGSGTRPRYSIAPYEPKPKEEDAGHGGRWQLILALGGAALLEGAKVKVPLDKLLKVSVGQTDERPITVDEIVRYYSHVEGGVHFEKSHVPTPAEDRLFMIAKIQVGAPLQHIATLKSIGHVVHEGLLPLRAAIESKPSPPSTRLDYAGRPTRLGD